LELIVRRKSFIEETSPLVGEASGARQSRMTLPPTREASPLVGEEASGGNVPGGNMTIPGDRLRGFSERMGNPSD